MNNLIKFAARKLLNRQNEILYCFLRVFYFCKLKKQLKDYKSISNDTWKHTLDSNKESMSKI